MKFGRRSTALITCCAFLLLHAGPALASPNPRSEEWWFDAWEIQNKVWPLAQGQGIIVALIDSGVAAELPDLKGVVLPGMEYGTSSRGDGRHDTDSKLGGHGTAMAALIAGQGLGVGMVGIAPKSKILPIGGKYNDAETIPYAVDHGAKVINISVGTPAAQCTKETQDAVNYALQRDVIVVAAAGNEGINGDSTTAPANCPGVLAVAAVDSNLEIWRESTPGDNVMVAAPGVAVGSIGKDGTFSSNNNGTSQAAALTSAVAALVRSRFPEMPAREVVQRMIATAKDTGPKGWDNRTGYGALIPYLALTANVPSNSPNPVYDRLEPSVSVKAKPSTTNSAAPLIEANKNSGSKFLRAWMSILVIVATVMSVTFYLFRRLKKRYESK